MWLLFAASPNINFCVKVYFTVRLKLTCRMIFKTPSEVCYPEIFIGCKFLVQNYNNNYICFYRKKDKVLASMKIAKTRRYI